jgi:hypothetical protein
MINKISTKTICFLSIIISPSKKSYNNFFITNSGVKKQQKKQKKIKKYNCHVFNIHIWNYQTIIQMMKYKLLKFRMAYFYFINSLSEQTLNGGKN